jgi:hypothetical protein
MADTSLSDSDPKTAHESPANTERRQLADREGDAKSNLVIA